MRDFLSYDPTETKPEFTEPVVDPVARARDHARADLPKRFYREVSVGPAEGGGWRVLLDGRPVRTPARRHLEVPRRDLAEAMAAEWAAQETIIDPRAMPHTRLANAVIDGVAVQPAAVAADALKYAGSDLLCYRATDTARLVDRQTRLWDPVLDWIEETYGARFLVAEGIVHVAQDPEAIAAVGRALEPLDPWRLGGLHSLTTLTGSLFIALALAGGRLDDDAAWAAATVDEAWNLELWGEDEEAVARLAARRREFDVASAFLREAPAGQP